jgi:hypothetical protein
MQEISPFRSGPFAIFATCATCKTLADVHKKQLNWAMNNLDMYNGKNIVIWWKIGNIFHLSSTSLPHIMNEILVKHKPNENILTH